MFQYTYEDANELEQQVDEYMREFDENELIAKEVKEKQLNTIDDDGFQLVKPK